MVWGILSILFGWTLFAYWWHVVIERTDVAIILYTVAVVVIIADVLILAAWGWIVHNQRLARRGTRGRATAFRTPQFQRDRINRQLILPRGDSLREAAVVVITASAQEKVYRAVAV